jgi:uncharacterized protein (TIGR00255 family)
LVVIRSMTGFASLSREAPGARVTVSVKSVNHRFLDVAIKAPHALAGVEHRIRGRVQERLTRGRVELSIGAEVTTPPEHEVVLDELLLERLAGVVDDARRRGLLTGGLSASDLLRVPHVLDVRVKPSETSGPPGAVTDLVDAALADALDALVGMRETEGRFLATDLEARLTAIAAYVDTLEREAREGERQLEQRLRERLAALPADVQADPPTLAQEVVRFVARSDVAEELVRMRSHLEHWRELAGSPEACGRKLDFLVQEMNREINTIGSKAEGARSTEVVIAAKAELERIREQVQNVE